MSGTVSLSGNDTVNLDGQVLADFADGDVANLTYPNDLVKVKVGKNGNAIFAFDNTGQQCTLVIRVIRGSFDDKYMNSIVADFKADSAGFTLLQAQLVKRIGDGQGNITNDTYLLANGAPSKQVPGSENVEGNTDQSVAVYEFIFANSKRAIF